MGSVPPLILFVHATGEGREQVLGELGRYTRDYRVEAVTNGDDAIARLSASRTTGEPVAMVLVDVAAPPVDGVAVLTRVRGAAPTARCVLLLDWGLRPEQVPVVTPESTVGSSPTVTGSTGSIG